jgi:hypothetical protein
VTRIADALDPATRTLMTEIDVASPDGALSPGIYCTVEPKIPRRIPLTEGVFSWKERDPPLDCD